MFTICSNGFWAVAPPVAAGLPAGIVLPLFYRNYGRTDMYVVFVENLDEAKDVALHTARTLDQAFAQIACQCGLSYRFESETEGWKLKPRDAHHDLMSQAVDGRLKGHVALHVHAYRRAQVMRTAQGMRVRIAEL